MASHPRTLTMYFIEQKKRINSKKYSPILELESEEKVLKYLNDNNIVAESKPYIFTHITLSNGQIITQRISGIICSPTKLANLLNL